VEQHFDDKQAAREAVWDELERSGHARFPTPPHGRIPNFSEAAVAAKRLFDFEPWRSATRIKVNPDAPQRFVRIEALRRGIEVFVPTPRLRGGFKQLDPARIDAGDVRAAAGLSKMDRFAQPVALDELPAMDAVVAGSVAVTADGARCGKGEGFADIELAILAELGHPRAPVATTVHDLQVVEALPQEASDLRLSLVVTPTRAIEIAGAHDGPGPGIDWSRLDEDDLDAMPVLRELDRTVASATGQAETAREGS